MRHPDTTTLANSNIIEKIRILQQMDELQFLIYGDSAYPWDTHLRSRHNGNNLSRRAKLENKALSSCREVIEWDYGQLFTQWKRLDYARGLRIRVMPVAKIMLVAIILRNAYTCMNGNECSSYFKCRPPSFENWVNQTYDF